jgi:hypothetical protein
MISTIERILFESIVYQLTPADRICIGSCSDLSVGGMYLITSSLFVVNERFKITFSVPFAGNHIEISSSARVAWTNYQDCRLKLDYPLGVGIEFVELSTNSTKLLCDYIYSYDETKKMNMVCAWCGKHLGVRKGPFGKTSHGICGTCREEHF